MTAEHRRQQIPLLYLGRLTEALASYRQYQALQSEEDRRVKGWVMDLERRLGV